MSRSTATSESDETKHDYDQLLSSSSRDLSAAGPSPPLADDEPIDELEPSPEVTIVHPGSAAFAASALAPRATAPADAAALVELPPQPMELDSEVRALSDIYAPHNFRYRVGFLAQYFAVGIIYAGLPATTYGFFLGYLGVPSYTYATVVVMSRIPWSFKFVFGALNDTTPIFGLRRKPYMILGWGFCALMLVALWLRPLPPPYWCVGEDGRYVTHVQQDGHTVPAEPCHPESAKAGGSYAILMALAATGYVVADVAADGLTVEYAKLEPISRRGNTQTTAYLTRSLGQACAALLVGLCMNSRQYNGSFEWGLSFNWICAILALPATAMVPISYLLVREPQRARKGGHSRAEYARLVFSTLRGGAFFAVISHSFLTPTIGNISTTAGGLVKKNWAGVKNLQDQIFSLFGHLLFAAGLWLVKRHFLNTSWRRMLIVTALLLNLLDLFFVTCTVFDVVRNQYFYLGETVLYEVPAAANFVVSTYVIVEMAEPGMEGIVYGLVTTAHNMGNPVARAVANALYGLFRPNLSDVRNYILDTPEFRRTVFYSFLLSFAFAAASLCFLPLLPDQKEEAQLRKRRWRHRDSYAIATIVCLGSALTYSLVVNTLSMMPTTMCLKIAGGDGCTASDQQPAAPLNATDSSSSS